MSVSTIADAPGRPQSDCRLADGKDAIDLTWKAPASGGNAIVRYELERWDVRHDAVGICQQCSFSH